MSWLDVGQNLVLDTGQSLLNAFAGIGNSIYGSKVNEKLMEKQQQLARENFDYELAAQKRLMKENASLQKYGLQAAGYSTADPSGTGFQQLSTPGMSDPSNPTVNPGFEAPQLSGIYQSVAQARLVNSQARLNEIDAITRGKSNEVQLKMLENDFQASSETLQTRIDTVKAQYQNLIKNNAKLDKEINQFTESIKNLQINNEILESTKEWKKKGAEQEYKKQVEEYKLLVKQNNIKAIEEKLANNGIMLGMDGITSLISIASQGKGGDVAELLGDLLGDVLSSIPKAIASALSGFLEGVQETFDLPGKIKNAWKSWISKK